MSRFICYKIDGTFTGTDCYQGTATEHAVPNGYAGVLQLADNDATAIDAFANPSHYTIQNNALVKTVTDAQLLAEAQTAKRSELQSAYQQTLVGGFNVTIGGTSHTFGWTTKDESDMSALQKAIDKAFQTFPVNYADINGNPVTVPDQPTLDTIEQTATKFAMAQHQQVLTLTGQVNTATTVSGVQSISWTAAPYL